MTVAELKNLLEGVADDMEVVIPMNPEFDGFFQGPCSYESGVGELAVPEATDFFIIVPCGFFDKEHGVNPQLN